MTPSTNRVEGSPRRRSAEALGQLQEDIARRCAPRERIPRVEEMELLRQKIGVPLRAWWGKGTEGRHTAN